MKYKTSELSGALLDAAVAKAEGDAAHMNYIMKECGPDNRTPPLARPYSSEWHVGGPIIEREQIILNPGSVEEEWEAGVIFDYGHEGPESKHWMRGPTPLIAAMRAYAASKFGEEVEL